MTQPDFLSGQLFSYKGHFHLIARDQWRYNAADDTLVNKQKNDTWYINSMSEDKFYVKKPGYGTIQILLKELMPVKENVALPAA